MVCRTGADPRQQMYYYISQGSRKYKIPEYVFDNARANIANGTPTDATGLKGIDALVISVGRGHGDRTQLNPEIFSEFALMAALLQRGDFEIYMVEGK